MKMVITPFKHTISSRNLKIDVKFYSDFSLVGIFLSKNVSKLLKKTKKNFKKVLSREKVNDIIKM